MNGAGRFPSNRALESYSVSPRKTFGNCSEEYVGTLPPGVSPVGRLGDEVPKSIPDGMLFAWYLPAGRLGNEVLDFVPFRAK